MKKINKTISIASAVLITVGASALPVHADAAHEYFGTTGISKIKRSKRTRDIFSPVLITYIIEYLLFSINIILFLRYYVNIYKKCFRI